MLKKIIPDEGYRKEATKIFAEFVELSNSLNPQNWVVTLRSGNSLRLMAGRTRTVSIEGNGLFVVVVVSEIPTEHRDDILARFSLGWKHQSLPDSQALNIPANQIADVYPIVRSAAISATRLSSKLTSTSVWRGNHVPAAIEFLNDSLQRPIPQPQFPPIQTANYWKLSAQSKGLVTEHFLKSGVMALDFASATFDIRESQPTSASDIQADFTKRGVNIDLAPNHAPEQLWSLLNAVKIGDRVFLVYNGMIRGAGTVMGEYEFEAESDSFQHQRVTDWEPTKLAISALSPQGASTLQTAFKTLQQLESTLGQEIEERLFGGGTGNGGKKTQWHKNYGLVFSNAGLTYTPWQQAVFFTALQTKGFVILSGISGTGKTKIAQAFAAALPQPPDGSRNVEFLTVRPDWRDSKSLIGYHNPLTDRYEWTPFLRFLLRACQSWEERDGLAWFVILDEMNLAHVEHYFAEMLSIIESGRDDDGWSRESIAIPSAGGEGFPPSNIKLPPNLHIIGTVNLDDTTHAFSPKVLDRAFALEFSDVSFADYLVSGDVTTSELDPLDASDILNALSSDGSFPRVDNAALSALLATDNRPRTWLESLNLRLRPHHLHFGFRVFDEVVAFVSYGKSNGLFNGMPPDGDPVTAAFDAAAMMKILPKFHGSRSRLDMPLKIVLAWCLNPTIPDLASINTCIAKTTSPQEMEQALLALSFHFPKTAERTIRLLWAAHVEGFAAFG
jgi:hypothetical protein